MMMEDSGRDPSGQALAVPATPANAVDGPSGFDPSRLSALSFVLPYDEGGERLSVVHDSRSRLWPDDVAIRQYESDDHVIYVALADLNWLIGALKLVAIATEARRAETPQDGSVHEGAGRQASPTLTPCDPGAPDER